MKTNCITCRCVYKQRCKNKIINYILEDTKGNKIQITPDKLKQAVQNKELNITNLKLTTDNRLVDKKEIKIDRVGEVEDKVLNKAKLLNLEIEKIQVQDNTYCYIIKQSENTYILYIPKNVTNILVYIKNMTNNIDITSEYLGKLHSIRGKLTVLGGEGLTNTLGILQGLILDELDLTKLKTPRISIDMFYIGNKDETEQYIKDIYFNEIHLKQLIKELTQCIKEKSGENTIIEIKKLNSVCVKLTIYNKLGKIRYRKLITTSKLISILLEIKEHIEIQKRYQEDTINRLFHDLSISGYNIYKDFTYQHKEYNLNVLEAECNYKKDEIRCTTELIISDIDEYQEDKEKIKFSLYDSSIEQYIYLDSSETYKLSIDELKEYLDILDDTICRAIEYMHMQEELQAGILSEISGSNKTYM